MVGCQGQLGDGVSVFRCGGFVLCDGIAEGGVIPDLAREIAWWQARMRPSNEQFGNGIADWTITGEYVDGLMHPELGEVWGLMCSPSMLPASCENLTPEDIAAKRAHIRVRTPKTTAEVAEVHETLPHELYHVLRAANSGGSVEAEEGAAHSVAPLLAELRRTDSNRARALARAIAANPSRARAYRARGSMPEPEEKKDPEKKDPPAQDGGSGMSIEDIEKALVTAKLAGDDAKLAELMNAWIAAKVAAAGAASPVTEPPPAPSMGMNPEDPAQMRARIISLEERAKAADEAATAAILDAHPHLDEKQQKLVKTAGSPARARELAASYQRPAELHKSAEARMGLSGHPATVAGGGKVAPKNAFRPSGNRASMARLRVVAEDDDTVTAPGCRIHDAGEIESTGKLMTMSIWEALPVINKSIQAKMGGTV
jgi:hypothetical protein